MIWLLFYLAMAAVFATVTAWKLRANKYAVMPKERKTTFIMAGGFAWPIIFGIFIIHCLMPKLIDDLLKEYE